MKEEKMDTSNVRGREDLKHFLDKVEEQEKMAPFPVRDTGIKEELMGKLKDNAVGYDNEPVVACPHCHSLHLITNDEVLECFNCGHELVEKDLIIYKSIYSYKVEDEDRKSTD